MPRLGPQRHEERGKLGAHRGQGLVEGGPWLWQLGPRQGGWLSGPGLRRLGTCLRPGLRSGLRRLGCGWPGLWLSRRPLPLLKHVHLHHSGLSYALRR